MINWQQHELTPLVFALYGLSLVPYGMIGPSVCELIEPAYHYDRWEKITVLSVLSHIIAHLGCLDSHSEATGSSGVPTLLYDKLTDDCSQHFDPQRLVLG